MVNTAEISAFERLFLALSDPTRLRLLTLMKDGPVSVGYLASEVGESQPKTSRHLAYLRNAGFVSTMREGKWVYYQIAKQPNGRVNDMLMTSVKHVSDVIGGHSAGNDRRSVEAADNISADPYMKVWAPNELEVHLL